MARYQLARLDRRPPIDSLYETGIPVQMPLFSGDGDKDYYCQCGALLLKGVRDPYHHTGWIKCPACGELSTIGIVRAIPLGD